MNDKYIQKDILRFLNKQELSSYLYKNRRHYRCRTCKASGIVLTDKNIQHLKNCEWLRLTTALKESLPSEGKNIPSEGKNLLYAAIFED